jgi:hypothetical protein
MLFSGQITHMTCHTLVLAWPTGNQLDARYVKKRLHTHIKNTTVYYTALPSKKAVTAHCVELRKIAFIYLGFTVI